MATRTKVIRPHWFLFLLLDGGIALLIQLALNKDLHQEIQDKHDDLLPSHGAIKGLLAGTAVIHTGEALVAGRMAAKRGLPRRGWMLQTFIVGFPSLSALRKVR
jgi:hypothetical protein